MNSSKDTLPSMPASVSAAAAMTRATSSMQSDNRQREGWSLYRLLEFLEQRCITLYCVLRVGLVLLQYMYHTAVSLFLRRSCRCEQPSPGSGEGPPGIVRSQGLRNLHFAGPSLPRELREPTSLLKFLARKGLRSLLLSRVQDRFARVPLTFT